MFGTLRAGKKKNAGSMIFEQGKHSRNSVNSNGACKTCRNRKLKCTGEATGCMRCKSSNLQCEYRGPIQDGRDSKSRKIQAATDAVTRKPSSISPNAQGQYSQSNDLQSSESIRSNCFDVNPRDPDIDFSVPSFLDPDLADGFYEDLPGVNTAGSQQNVEGNQTFDGQDLNFSHQSLRVDMMADMELPVLDASHYGTSPSDSDNGFNSGTPPGNNVDSTFADQFPAPQVQWNQVDGASSRGTVSIPKKIVNGSCPPVSRSSIPSSNPTSSCCHGGSPFTVTFPELQPQPKLTSPESSSESDRDSSTRQCRCSNRALRLLEKLPNVSQSSSSSLSSGASLSPNTMEIAFSAETKPQGTSMTKPSFIQAATLFLGNFPQSLAVFSTISQCRRCLRKSSFSMILLILAQRLTSRINLLLQRYIHVPERDSNPQKFTLTIAESAIEYDDPLSPVSTLMAGKVCRLAAYIARVKSVCLTARWTSYERGFESLEAPLRECMSELEAMM